MAFGVYVHVPFCRHRCDYCAFATWTDRHELTDRYLAACRRQLVEASADLPPVTSVFVGGGTPSLVPAAGLVQVLAAVPRADDAEVTVECNPDDVSAELLRAYRDAGVNRLSIGVQSMAGHVLEALGRSHRPDNVRRAAEAAHELELAFNLDLIYGSRGERPADWARTVDEAIGLDPAHISAYALTVEPGTPLADDVARHPDQDDQADKYELVTDRLEAAGYEWYEISNWARPGHRCRHNLLYWSQGEYLGIGCAAHSHRHGRRWWSLRTPERYVAAIEEGSSAAAGGEQLAAAERRLEGLQLALRTESGVPADAFGPHGLTELDGLIVAEGDRVVLSRSGRLLANEVALRLKTP